MTKNPSPIFMQKSAVDAAAREQMLGHQSRTLWFTGFSGAGKSSLAYGLEERLISNGIACYVLDGDNLRHGINEGLDFSPEGRKENIRRVAQVARLFNEAGIVVIVALISPLRIDREMARSIIGVDKFDEVFVSTSLEECEKRDVKGLYAKARTGEIAQFTGISAPYETPDFPALILNTEGLVLKELVSDLESWVWGRIQCKQ